MRNQIATAFYAGLLGSLTLFACSGGGSGGGIPLLPDADGDGLPDSLERSLSSDPADPDDPYPAGDQDTRTPEGPGVDNIPDGLENYIRDTSTFAVITARTDTDFDGIPDYAEIQSGFDHLDFNNPTFRGNEDLDETGPPLDGINDGLEIFLLRNGASRPVTAENDTDGDGFEDVIEIRSGTDPFDASDPFFIARFDITHQIAQVPNLIPEQRRFLELEPPSRPAGGRPPRRGPDGLTEPRLEGLPDLRPEVRRRRLGRLDALPHWRFELLAHFLRGRP